MILYCSCSGEDRLEQEEIALSWGGCTNSARGAWRPPTAAAARQRVCAARMWFGAVCPGCEVLPPALFSIDGPVSHLCPITPVDTFGHVLYLSLHRLQRPARRACRSGPPARSADVGRLEQPIAIPPLPEEDGGDVKSRMRDRRSPAQQRELRVHLVSK